MDILPLETLTVEGLTLPQVQQSLCIKCFGKSFQRKSDVPKKFKIKAINLADELLQDGIESFVTETNFSYTVWAEEKTKKQAPSAPVSSIKSEPITPVSTIENKTFNSPFISSPVLSVVPSKYEPPTPVQEYQPPSLPVQESQPVLENNEQVEQKYRGRVVEESAVEKNRRIKRKPKTYRGVTYS